MNVTSYLQRTKNPDLRTTHYQELVREYYETVTTFYWKGWGENFHFAPFQDNESLGQALAAQRTQLVRETGMSAGMKVLDVGCGIGGPTRHIARISGAKLTGITISPRQVRVAQELVWKQRLQDRCQILLGDAMELDFKDEAFDVVYMIESACHMPDKQAFFVECARVLKPGGCLAGWDWIRSHPRAGDADSARSVEPICAYFALPSLCTLEEIRDHLTGAGLDVVRTEDLADSGTARRRWWDPLERRVEGVLSQVTSRLSPTLRMMRESGQLLVEAGKRGAFSPLGYFVARKP